MRRVRQLSEPELLPSVQSPPVVPGLSAL